MARSSLTPRAQNLPGLLAEIDAKFPALAQKSRTKTASCASSSTSMSTMRTSASSAATRYEFQDGDEVMLIPSIAGGL